MDSSLTTDTPTSLRRWLLSEQAQTDLAAVANGTMSGFRLANILYQCVNRTPQLTTCTLPDLFTAARTLVILGCEPDNVHGYLVPRNIKTPTGFRTIPVHIPSARGLVRTARANGVRNLNIGTVYAGDTFEWSISGGRFNYSHTSAWEPSGELCGFYCTWEDKDGYLHGVRMSVSEVNAKHRDRSDAYRRAESKGTAASPWHTDYEEMALKTVIKRAAKQWDMPLEFQQALQDADTVESGTDKEAMRNVSRRRTALEEELPNLPETPPADATPAPGADALLFDLPPDTSSPRMEADS